LIAAKGKEKVTRPIREWGETARTLHLVPDVFSSGDESEQQQEQQPAPAVEVEVEVEVEAVANDDDAATLAMGL
jgi:hypothetical protein